MKTLERIKRGLPLVRTLMDKINEIVDYLRATRIVEGKGIRVNESAAGLVISVNESSQANNEEDLYAFVTAGHGIKIEGSSEIPAIAGGMNSTVPISGSTFSLLLEAGTSNVSITDGENGSKVISVTGSTCGCDPDPFPDYIALSTVPEGITCSSKNGIGTTFLAHVHSGVNIMYEAPSGLECLVLFAESVEGTAASMGGTTYLLSGGTAFPAPGDGYVRFSVLDDGQHVGECVRLFVGTSDWTEALPVYRCGSFVSGITSSLSGGTVSISLSGGTGSVKLKAGDNIKITSSNGVYTISVTGISISGATGGSLDIPQWGGSQGSETPGGAVTHLYNFSGGNEIGYLHDHSYFQPSTDGWIYCFAELHGYSTYSCVHVSINGGLWKVCSAQASTGTIIVGSSILIPVKADQPVTIYPTHLDNSSTVGCVFYAI